MGSSPSTMGSLPCTNIGSSPSTNIGSSSLPGELVHDILDRLPLEEPEHLASASLVCKAWRRVLSHRGFWLRYREFHGAPPLLLGYIQNPYYNCCSPSSMGFVHTIPSIVSPITSMPEVDCSGWIALDCRHGRVLILDDAKGGPSKRRLIVWDPITGSQQHLSVPSAIYGSYPSYSYTGAVMCAIDGCDHLDCHGGPFHVVIVEANRAGAPFAIAAKYSSLTRAWGAPTSNDIFDRHDGSICRVYSCNGKHNLLIGDVLHFPYGHGQSIIVRYDLRAHWLSKMDLPQHMSGAILMKAEDGGLGLANLKDNCIHLWSGQYVPNVILPSQGRTQWVEHRVMNLGTLVPRQVPFESYKVIGFAEGTNTIFINISAGIFMLDLDSKKVRKVGEREADRVDPILPYMSIYGPR